jgi:hypothetical protein
MVPFFLQGDCSDRGYRNIRDAARSPAIEGRAFTEALWTRYAPLADPRFRQDASAHFTERFWEMYLTIAMKIPESSSVISRLRR